MRAIVLKSFIEGKLSAANLSKDPEGTTVHKCHNIFGHRMTDLSQDFQITSDHLVMICNAVLDGDIRPEQLAQIAFGMIASDYFLWDSDTPDGKRVADTLFDWVAPEINYDLNINTVEKFRHRLLTGEDTFTRDDFANTIKKAK